MIEDQKDHRSLVCWRSESLRGLRGEAEGSIERGTSSYGRHWTPMEWEEVRGGKCIKRGCLPELAPGWKIGEQQLIKSLTEDSQDKFLGVL